MTAHGFEIPAAAVPQKLSAGWLWWLIAITSIPIGAYAIALQDARDVQNAVPGLPWLDEVHFVAGGIALAVGPFGFRRDLLARARAWHRKLGWIYVLGVTTSGLAALAMACFSMHGLATHLGFGVLAVLWLSTTTLGVRAIQRRDVARHRRFMVLSFALCYAAVTLRVQLGPLAMSLQSFEAGYRIVSWSCWVPNLLVAYWWLSRTTLAGTKRPAAPKN